jgi:pimeloyl-ACP methyl ester carboxylesterase
VVALDIINLMDALKIQKAIIGGFDWGGQTADITVVLWPERCKAIVSVSGYLITSLKANLQPLPPKASDFDGPAASGTGYRSKFTGKYSHRILNGIGHNVPQEAPQAFAQAAVDVDGY